MSAAPATAGAAAFSSEQPEGLRVVADQQALRLRVVVEHHLVVLPPDARDLVAAEGRVSRVEVVAVRPHAPGLDAAAHAERLARVPRPHARAEAVERVVRDLERVVLALERRHREHRAEDLLLEDPHLVPALEDGRLEVVAILQLAAEVRRLAADQELCALVEADPDVALDLVELRRRDLGAELRVEMERMTL